MFTAGQKTFVLLEDRGVVRIAGPDVRSFLQGLVTNDVEKAVFGRVVYAALLTPQGKYLHDFFIVAMPDENGNEVLYLDCERKRAADLVSKLTAYKLRAKVTIENATDRYRAIAMLGDGPHDSEALHGFEGRGGPFAGGICYVDPRYAGVGARALLPNTGFSELIEAEFQEKAPEFYERQRIYYGLPDGSRDLEIGKSIPLEANFDQIHAVDWEKGCYVGQELTARTHYRGLIRKRLLPAEIEGSLPAYGTPITAGGEEIGEMRTSFDGYGIGLFRIDSLVKAVQADQPVTAGDAKLSVMHPAWLKEPAEAPTEGNA
jgi:folate-binding protein YgfZ